MACPPTSRRSCSGSYPSGSAARLLPALDQRTRRALEVLLRYPPETAGGIMTTEFLTRPVRRRTVEDALQPDPIGSGGAKETVYADVRGR